MSSFPFSRLSGLGLLLLLTVNGAHPADAVSQRIPVGDMHEDYLRVIQVLGLAEAGSFLVRPLSAVRVDALSAVGPWAAEAGWPKRNELAGGLWWSGVDVYARSFVNSAFPTGQNDGAVWQGKGVTVALEAGGTLGLGPFELTLRPRLIYAQNEEFELARPDRSGDEVYRDPWAPRTIDLPQRFGPDPLSEIDLGTSSFRVDLGPLTVGLGSENMWWGPGVQNAILMTNNAGGFPHADFSTDGPVDIGIGTLEAGWVWGRLSHSAWWDTTQTNEDRFFTGAAAAYSPSFAPGLSLGFSRAYHRGIPEGGLDTSEYFLIVQGIEKREFATLENPLGQDVHDQLFSVFGRLMLPESGFELWAEWARNDHAWDLRDLFIEPEHSRAFVLGGRKAGELTGGRILTMTLEMTHLEADPTFQVRGRGTYYHHDDSPQGYTHEGQVLGAGVGPGGNAQFAAADLYHSAGLLGVFIQRRVHENDAYYEQAGEGEWCCHWVSLDFGGRAIHISGGVEWDLKATLTRDFNRYFIQLNEAWNANLRIAGRWRMK